MKKDINNHSAGVRMGQRIKAIREARGMTRAELGSFVGLDQNRVQQYENGWQRMRMLATITIQPHVRSKITPQRLLPFPWESPKRKTAAEPIVSKEEDLERFKKLTGGMGKG